MGHCHSAADNGDNTDDPVKAAVARATAYVGKATMTGPPKISRIAMKSFRPRWFRSSNRLTRVRTPPISHQIPKDSCSTYAVRSVVINRTPTAVRAMPFSRTYPHGARKVVDLSGCFREYDDRIRLNANLDIRRDVEWFGLEM